MILRLMTGALLISLSCACASFKRIPDEVWVTTPNLSLSAESLQDLSVKLVCNHAKDQRDKKIRQVTDDSPCRDLAQVLKGFGARVPGYEQNEESENSEALDSSGQVADLTLTLTSYDAESDYCGWTLFPFIITLPMFGAFPCVEDVSIAMSWQLYLRDGQLAASDTFHSGKRVYYGLSALMILMSRSSRPVDAVRRHPGQNMRTFFLNEVYSWALHQKNESSQERGH